MPSGRQPVPSSLGIEAARDVAHCNATDKCICEGLVVLRSLVGFDVEDHQANTLVGLPRSNAGEPHIDALDNCINVSLHQLHHGIGW